MTTLHEIPKDKQKVVSMILSFTDLYKVLFVTSKATTEDINKQYKKLCILVHPDRNDHPRAGDAFKKLSAAKHVLTDRRLRERYDRTGVVDERPASSRFAPGWTGDARFGNFGTQMPFEYEDLFNMFFSPAQHSTYGFSYGTGGFARTPFEFFQGSSYMRGGPRRSSHNAGLMRSRWFQLLSLLSIVLYVLWQLEPTYEGYPEFRFYEGGGYRIKQETEREGVEYWIKNDFDHERLLRKSFREKFEAYVVDRYKEWKQMECRYEMQQIGRIQETPLACSEWKALMQMA